VRIASTRIGQQKHGRTTDALGLRPQRRFAFTLGEECAIHRHADERDDRWSKAEDLAPKPGTSSRVFRQLQLANAARGSCDDVRDAVPPIRQPIIV
jgi:hypothetical protein